MTRKVQSSSPRTGNSAGLSCSPLLSAQITRMPDQGDFQNFCPYDCERLSAGICYIAAFAHVLSRIFAVSPQQPESTTGLRMAADLDDSYAARHSIVNDLFIKTADENYVTARFCFAYGLDVDFFWVAVHALEKYLKAALLLNGKSCKNHIVSGKPKSYGHNIIDLYAAVQPLAPELITAKLIDTAAMYPTRWFDESTGRFIVRLYDMGNEHNRYQLSGYVRQPENLFKLDQVVFAVRRLCQPLESHFLGKKHVGVPDQSRRERMVIDHPSSSNLHSALERIIAGGRGRKLQHIALNWNQPFAPADYRHSRIDYAMSSVNPVLVRRILDPLDVGDAQQQRESDELWQWVQDNIYLPKDYVTAYNVERAKRKAAAKARR